MADQISTSLWDDTEAAGWTGELGPRIYTSRLLGRDRSLVLHGGGNTSVKLTGRDLFGEEEELLYVKGSGADLAEITAPGFTPLPLARIRRLAELPALSDGEMARELARRTRRPGAPAPSVESILHALLPGRYVDHTHADAFIAVSNSPGGSARLREIYGRSVVYIPYVMPGFDLARRCAELFPRERTDETIGLALEHHGLFSFGETARESYERMIDLVGRAGAYLQRRQAWQIPFAPGAPLPAAPRDRATLRRDLSQAAGRALILTSWDDEAIRAFVGRDDLAALAGRGPATPDHSIRTKRVPLVGRDVAAAVADYRRYFEKESARSPQELTMLDPAPRVVLDAQLGLMAAGDSAAAAAASAEIYRHTLEIILRAEALGGWEALPTADIFDVEYWELEQAKLKRQSARPVLAGEVAFVTGAASGIGKACVAAFLERGAAVVGCDLNPAVETLHARPDYLGVACDLTDEGAMTAALARAVRAFGGVDMLVLNAGIFPPSAPLAGLPTEQWRRVLGINLDASFALLREAHAYLRLAPQGGRVVVIGSKNVPAPGPGAAAYSASKAALNQLARVAALEWGRDRIRINSIHPNGVFDTALWTPEVLARRAEAYGLSVEEYRTNNILRTEVTSHD
ncbi:MAG: bifunctional aldolase/short-chain dehydrogenase, partial [Cephaloticoccus sp.]|nr:bifunctional aldolase/short-chain dehydrogenase [Cephaloticoccus sp.]